MFSKNDNLKSDVMEELLHIKLPEKMGLLYSGESPLDKPVHGMPRLNVLLENSLNFRIWKDGGSCEYTLEAPAFYYCTASGYQWAKDPSSPRRAVSFCYFKEYIRVVIFRSKNDITYYHSSRPLSPGTWRFIEAVEMLRKETPGAEEIMITLLKVLFKLTVAQLENDPCSEPVRRLNQTWTRINAYLRAHRTENLSREKIASRFRISPGFLSRLAKRYTGMKFSKLRTVYKLELADELLRSTDMTLDEIADECGFSYTSHFHRCYRSHFGITPRRRRETLEENTPQT